MWDITSRAGAHIAADEGEKLQTARLLLNSVHQAKPVISPAVYRVTELFEARGTLEPAVRPRSDGCDQGGVKRGNREMTIELRWPDQEIPGSII